MLVKLKQALPFFKTALEVNQTIAQFWLSYIDALIKLDRIEDAKGVFEAQRNGATGEGFDQLEQRLGLSKSLVIRWLGNQIFKSHHKTKYKLY